MLNSLLSSAADQRGWSNRRRSTAPPTRRSTSSPTSARASGARSRRRRRRDRRLSPQPAARLRRDARRSRQRRAGASRTTRGRSSGRAEDARRRPGGGAAGQPDRATQLHIDDVRMQIARALDPTVQLVPARRERAPTCRRSQFDVTGDRHLLAGLRCGAGRSGGGARGLIGPSAGRNPQALARREQRMSSQGMCFVGPNDPEYPPTREPRTLTKREGQFDFDEHRHRPDQSGCPGRNRQRRTAFTAS